MKKQIFNPYLPSFEYIPDGEPHNFNGRVYIYGSHDWFNGAVFCMGDYVCYSAPEDDLTDWRYEGVIYPRTADPMNANGKMCLYAPDVTQGPDGRYYLYYVYDGSAVVGVAVCDTPAGQYKFYGNVHRKDGTLLGQAKGDPSQFDPGVMTEGDKVYLYTGYAPVGDKSRRGAMVTVLDKDGLTVLENPKFIVPSDSYSAGTGYEKHEFFEASSIRKINGLYYFIYSSIVNHELCYAVSKKPDEGFVYGGVVVSNADVGVDSYKPKDMAMAYGGNNHGGIVFANGDYYIFYHRHTNATHFSRQGCAQKIKILEDGSIPQVEMTSCGLNGAPLEGKGFYPAYIACNLFTQEHIRCTGSKTEPYFTQDGGDIEVTKDNVEILSDCIKAGKEFSLNMVGAGASKKALQAELDKGLPEWKNSQGFPVPYIGNIKKSMTCGFKYFDCKGIKEIALVVRGYPNGVYEIRTKWNGPVLATIPVNSCDTWREFSAPVNIPDGVNAIYISYVDKGAWVPHELKGFILR